MKDKRPTIVAPPPVASSLEPDKAAGEGRPLSGERRELEQRASISKAWPKTKKEQYAAFRAWYAIAAQVCRLEKIPRSTLAAFPFFINYREGFLWPSNEQLAQQAGGDCGRTITRHLADYEKAGIIRMEVIPKGRGKGSRRNIFLRYPRDLESSIMLPDDDFDQDHACQGQTSQREQLDQDTTCRVDQDTWCLAKTLKDSDKKDDVPAKAGAVAPDIGGNAPRLDPVPSRAASTDMAPQRFLIPSVPTLDGPGEHVAGTALDASLPFAGSRPASKPAPSPPRRPRRGSSEPSQPDLFCNAMPSGVES